MKQVILVLLFVVFSRAGYAQASAHAVATATIVNPVGVEDIPDEDNSVQLSLLATTRKGKSKTAASQSIDMSNFRIVGAGSNLYSLSVASPAVYLVNQASCASFAVEELQVVKAPTAQPEIFSLNGKPKLRQPLAAGRYANEAPLDVVVHFN